jgi:O-antigen/teichoic acid export membrane protein
MAGYGSSQILRLAGNLAFTRLLVPEVFGLMALVQTFLTGLAMFSDLGILPSIIQSKRGGELSFLNTAWTIQVIRGTALWVIACLIAVPVAQLYREPMLAQLLPVTALSSVIAGFASTKLATANRQLAIRRLTLIEVGTFAIQMAMMLVAAWFYRSIWVLVLGGIFGSLLKTLASHWLLEGERNRFCWNQEALQELRNFGRWIFLSTVVAFFGLQGDRLVLGWLLDVRFLGIYTVALNLSGAVEQIIDQINGKVMFPSYAELIRERPSVLYSTLRKARLILIGLGIVCAIALVAFGEPLIALLYDDRYLEAGWILRVLAIGFLGRVLCITYSDVLLARGDTFSTMSLTVIYTCIQLTIMPVGFTLAGYRGVIIGIAITDWLTYLAYAVCFKRLSLWQPELDLPTAAIAAGLAAIIYST